MKRYEVHVTVDGDEDSWYARCTEYGIKPIKITLSHGTHFEQLMCAARFVAPSYEIAEKISRGLEESIAEEFTVLRMKLEAPLKEFIPTIKPAYFENHMKCILGDFQVSILPEIIPEHCAISFSEYGAVRHQNKVFITERVHDFAQRVGFLDDDLYYSSLEVGQRFDTTEKLLENLITSSEREVVYVDTNPDLDAEWL